MNTAEHMILAKPDVWCSSGSPGGGTYGVLSSSDFARAMSASRLETVACGGAGAAAFTTGVSASYPMAAVQTVSTSAVAIVCILIPYLPARDEPLPAYMSRVQLLPQKQAQLVQ